jgi:hypothetical protein
LIAVSVMRHRGENLNHTESCSEFGRAALRWINSAGHELRCDGAYPMIRLRLIVFLLIAGRERFSRAGFRGVRSCPVYISPAAVSNAGSSICWSGWSTVVDGPPAPWFWRDWLSRFSRTCYASSHLGLSSESRAGRRCRPTNNRY